MDFGGIGNMLNNEISSIKNEEVAKLTAQLSRAEAEAGANKFAQVAKMLPAIQNGVNLIPDAELKQQLQARINSIRALLPPGTV